MMWLSSLAFAAGFDSDLESSAPFDHHIELRQQAVFSKTTLGFTTLDAGTSFSPLNGRRLRLGITGQAAGAAILGPQDTVLQTQSLGAALWVGVRRQRSDSLFGFAATAPPTSRRTFGLMEYEADWTVGIRHQWRHLGDAVQVLVASEAHINPLTLLGASISTMVTKPVLDGRLGLQAGGKLGTSRIAWLSGGAQLQASDHLLVGASVLAGLSLVGRGPPVHVSPLLSVQYRP